MDSGNDVVLFYEGIKTNGLGTIKISKVLSEQLFQLESNYLLTHIKYTASDNNVFSMINHPLWVMWALFRTIKTNIKVRSRL